jgi:hypothetical protein
MDQSEVNFPFNGDVEMTDPETGEVIRLNADGIRQQYLKQLDEFREFYMQQCSQARIDYVALSTDMPFDKALTKYLLSRKGR